MAGRQATPRQGKAYAVSALLAVLVSAWYAGPAIASPPTRSLRAMTSTMQVLKFP